MPKPPKNPKQLEVEEGKGRGMAWFIIIIMVASTAGFALVASGTFDQDNAPPAPPLPPDTPQTPTIIDYHAENVEGEVVEIFSSMHLTANTEEADITKIDTELLSIEGVRSVNSRYRQGTTELAAGFTYAATLALTQGKTAKEMLQKISEKSKYLSAINGGPFGMVSIPKTITLKNTDLNLTDEHTFDDPLMQAYLTKETRKGDELKIGMNLKLSGNEPFDIIAYETQNITVGPYYLTSEGEYSVAELLPELSAAKDVNYSRLPNEESLREAIASIEGVNSSALEYGKVANFATIEFDANISEMHDDLNATLSEINGIKNIRFFSSRNALNFDFDENFSSEQYKTLRERATEALNQKAKISNFIDPLVVISADLNINTIHADEISQALANIFAEKEVAVEVHQKALFKAESISPPDSEDPYTIKEGSFTAPIVQGAEVGDTVTLSVFFQGFRDEAREIMAVER